MVNLVRMTSIVHQNTVVDWLRMFLAFQPERVQNVVRTVTALLDKNVNLKACSLGSMCAKRNGLEDRCMNPFVFKITNYFLLLCE